jgi:lipopolysaccharide/colanic/teichoic acid biosynthesis glycosyltransferase
MRVETQMPPSAVSRSVTVTCEIAHRSGGFYVFAGKRLFDLVCSIAGLIVLSPVLLLLAALVKFSSRGPIFFSQTRVGRGAKLFRLIKFRSMRGNAAAIGPAITSADDARITKFGRFLRNTKLDEIPQLWNVLLGEMSLVGPRPEVPRFVHHCAAYIPLLAVRPGITDPSSIAFRHEELLLANQQDPELFYRKQLLPAKLALSSDYIKNVSFLRDISILLRTFVSVFQASSPKADTTAYDPKSY